jgi:thiol-disulfide isomerase/thioredoxin
MINKLSLKKAVGILMIVFLLGGLAALPAQAGVTEGNSGRGGQPIDVKQFVKPGQTTIIDFYSTSCAPCMKLAPMLAAMAAKRPRTQVVKLSIDRPGAKGIDFDSPLAKQYNLTGIPHLMVFDENGQLKAQGREALPMVLEWCK